MLIVNDVMICSDEILRDQRILIISSFSYHRTTRMILFFIRHVDNVYIIVWWASYAIEPNAKREKSHSNNDEIFTFTYSACQSIYLISLSLFKDC